jgi:uncharacterized protein YkwD
LLWTAAFFVAFCVLLVANTTSYAQRYPAADIETAERTAEALITEYVNAERLRSAPEAPHLQTDTFLAAIARQRSEEMARGAPFGHEDGEGRFVAADRIYAHLGSNGTVGENIMMERLTIISLGMGAISLGKGAVPAFDPDVFARRAVQDWLNSPDHRRNILESRFDRTGVGVAVAGSSFYATQVFWGEPRLPPDEDDRRK